MVLAGGVKRSDSSSDELVGLLGTLRVGDVGFKDCCACCRLGFGAESDVLGGTEDAGFGVDGPSEMDGEYTLSWE